MKIIDLDNVEEYLREKHKDEPEGIYIIGSKPYNAHTGKNGAIEFEIAFWRKVIKKYGPIEVK